jgi:hypothetical protein
MLASKAPMRAAAAPSRQARALVRAGPPHEERLRAGAARARAWAARRPATTLMLGVSSTTLLVATRLGSLDALAEAAALVAARPERLPPEAWLLALLLSSAGRTALSILAALAAARWFDRALDARDARLAAAEARRRALSRSAAKLLARLEAAAAFAPEAATLSPRWIADLLAERPEEARPAEEGESVTLRCVRLVRGDAADRARLEALFAASPAEVSCDGGEEEEEDGSDA